MASDNKFSTDLQKFIDMDLPGVTKTSALAIPWDVFGIPKTNSSMRFLRKCDVVRSKNVMLELSKKDITQIAGSATDKQNSDLMSIMSDSTRHISDRDKILPLIIKINLSPRHLIKRNEQGEDVLYMSIVYMSESPFISGLLASMYARAGVDLNIQTYTEERLNPIHLCCYRGDLYADSLEELLKVRIAQRGYVFDIDKKTAKGKTPLHIAVEKNYDPNGDDVHKTIKTVKILLAHGADVTCMDYETGLMPLSIAIQSSADPEIVQMLLKVRGCETINNQCREMRETPLHKLAKKSGMIPLEVQRKIWKQLISGGADDSILNVELKKAIDYIPTVVEAQFR